jgi:hypothetical protein
MNTVYNYCKTTGAKIYKYLVIVVGSSLDRLLVVGSDSFGVAALLLELQHGLRANMLALLAFSFHVDDSMDNAIDQTLVDHLIYANFRRRSA